MARFFHRRGPERIRSEASASAFRETNAEALFAAYKMLSYEERNACCLNILQENLANQKYLLYGWPIQQLYSKYADRFLPEREGLEILEIGPGDHLTVAALWMLEKRVKRLTLLDRYKGAFVDSARYHAQLYDLVATISHLPRDGFNNYFPFSELCVNRPRQAIRIGDDGNISLDPALIRYALLEDFARFPFEDGSFDYIYSHATLEHMKDPFATICEMFRILRRGGIMAHQIDIRDHRNFSDPYRYLETPRAEWNFGDLVFPVNQWRAGQFRQAFLDAGFELLVECKVRREPEKAEHIQFAPEFNAMEREDVLITGITFLLKRIG